MNSSRVTLALVLAAAFALSGCAETHSASVGQIDSTQFGEANRQTYAAMIIDPDPQYDKPMETSAEHAAAAAERYRKGTVKQPVRTSTTSVSGGGGSAGGGGGS